MTIMMTEKILLVGGEPDAQLEIQGWLQRAGYEVDATLDSGSMLTLVANDMPRLILLDLDIAIGDPFTGNFDGIAAMHWLRNQVEEAVRPPVIVLLRCLENSEALRARGAGAAGLLSKPVDESELVALVGSVLEKLESPMAQCAS
jgi:CheY-like chemotaxis protein